MAPFQVFCEYLALKSHFSNPKYDYFKYNKKVKATITSFNRRKDRYFFERTSRKYNDKEVIEFLLANFVESDNANSLWIGEIINSGEKNYSDWVRRQQSLTYLLKEQSEQLLFDKKLEDIFNCSKGHPILLKKFFSKNIDIEVMVIYDKIFDYVKQFDKKLTDPVWEMVSMKIKKYSPFLQNIDIFKYKKILRELVNE